MKIRKSRLKQIIKEEVEGSKFIPVGSGEPSIVAPGLGDFGQDAIAVLKQTRDFIDKMIEDDQVYGNMVDSSIARLQGIAKFHKELSTRMNEDSFYDSSTETAEAAEVEAEDDTDAVDESTRLLDEVIVQEIIKALAEGPLSHTHQAQALKRKEKAQGALGHNDAAALKYHMAKSEEEKWGGNKGDQNRSATTGEKSLKGANDFEPVFEEELDLDKAIDKDHEGYCTPMTKSTCTPPRKAMAKRLKPGGDLYKDIHGKKA